MRATISEKKNGLIVDLVGFKGKVQNYDLESNPTTEISEKETDCLCH